MELQLQTELLRKTPVFRSLSEPLLQSILKAPENRIEDYAPKHLIIRESELGDCMYIILEGSVEVLIRAESSGREIAIATLRAGDFFGERSLLPGSTGRRNATVRSIYQTKVFRIDKKYVLLSVKRDDFHLDDDEEVTMLNLNVHKPVQKVVPPAAPQVAARPAPPPLPPLPPDEVRDTIMKLRLFKSLNRDELLTIHDWTEVVTVGPGEFIIKESQVGQAMYVILEGEVEIFTLDHEGKIVILATLNNGDYFGEQALMPDSKGKRNAFVRSDKISRLIKIPKDYFRLVLNRDSDLYKELLRIHTERNVKLHEIKKS
jgi:CRP-like cAMP-binding protein